MKIGKMPRNSSAPRFTSFRTQQPALRASFSSGEHTPALQRKEIQRPQRCYAIGSIVSAEWNDDDYIEVGTLGRAHGIKGEVIVGLSTSSPDERFGRPGKRYRKPPHYHISCHRSRRSSLQSCRCPTCRCSVIHPFSAQLHCKCTG